MSNAMAPRHSNKTSGFSMIEVLVTIFILAFGLLGLAGMMMQIQAAEMESYQRAQALILAGDMAERIIANRANAANFSTSVVGTGDSHTSCTSIAAGTPDRDICEWSLALKGSAELSGSTSVGAMIDARGCVTQVQAANAASGVCTPGIYRVDVVWQGLAATSAPSVTCGKDLYGTDTNRRAISRLVTIGLPACT